MSCRSDQPLVKEGCGILLTTGFNYTQSFAAAAARLKSDACVVWVQRRKETLTTTTTAQQRSCLDAVLRSCLMAQTDALARQGQSRTRKAPNLATTTTTEGSSRGGGREP